MDTWEIGRGLGFSIGWTLTIFLQLIVYFHRYMGSGLRVNGGIQVEYSSQCVV
jgi:hypothetical protein